MTKLHKILKIRKLTKNTRVLRFERKNIHFRPGQYLIIGPAHYIREREYSIYSGINDPWFEILVRKVSGGDVSEKLFDLTSGDELKVSLPEGNFLIPNGKETDARFIFVGTGTGIAPFRSFARSFPGLNYKIIHGIGTLEECYDSDEYDRNQYFSCISRQKGGDYFGRVTSYLEDAEFNQDTVFYLCGNSDMIYEVYRLLGNRGINEKRIFSEVYF